MSVHVLRLSHRAARDKRVTTHLGLVSRAFGAEKMIVVGPKDPDLANSIQRVVTSWGGPFSLEFAKSWRDVLEEYKAKGFKTIQLTMYGMPVQKQISKIRGGQDILIIVGGEKVPTEVYHTVDYNVAVTSQPHSEISALAVFLDRFFDGKELEKKFVDAKTEVLPQERSKQVLSR